MVYLVLVFALVAGLMIPTANASAASKKKKGIIKESTGRRIQVEIWIMIQVTAGLVSNRKTDRKKRVYSKRKIWISDSEEKELIISFFIVSLFGGNCGIILNGVVY